MTMRQAYLDDLRDIVNIDSQSCDLPGLRKVAETLKAKFEAIGCVGRIDHIDDRAGRLPLRHKINPMPKRSTS